MALSTSPHVGAEKDIVPDGEYTYTVRGTLFRLDELGKKTQEHLVATSGSLSGTVTGSRSGTGVVRHNSRAWQ